MQYASNALCTELMSWVIFLSLPITAENPLLGKGKKIKDHFLKVLEKIQNGHYIYLKNI